MLTLAIKKYISEINKSTPERLFYKHAIESDESAIEYLNSINGGIDVTDFISDLVVLNKDQLKLKYNNTFQFDSQFKEIIETGMKVSQMYGNELKMYDLMDPNALPLELDLDIEKKHMGFMCPVTREVVGAGEEVAMLPCRHVLSMPAVEMLNKRCPFCKREFEEVEVLTMA